MDYVGVDLAAQEDCTVVAVATITPEQICCSLGVPLEALPDGENELTRFKRAMWPLFSEGRLSRKRFKKLLMAHGVERNLAEKAAVHYNKRRVPYFAAYKEAVALSMIKELAERIEGEEMDGE